MIAHLRVFARRDLRLGALAAAILLVAGASVALIITPRTPTEPSSPSAASTAFPFMGTWEFRDGAYRGELLSPLPGYPITLTFVGSEISGISGCNHYAMDVVTELSSSGREIRVKVLRSRSSTVGCGPDVDKNAESYLTALSLFDTGSVDSTGLLTLQGPNLALRFRLKGALPLDEIIGRVWTLTALVSRGDREITPPNVATLSLMPGGALMATTGCRRLIGSYALVGGRVEITRLTAEGSCPTALSSLDREVVGVLGSGFDIALIDGQLVATARGGDQLIYALAPLPSPSG